MPLRFGTRFDQDGLHASVFGRSSLPENNALFVRRLGALVDPGNLHEKVCQQTFACKDWCVSLKFGALVDRDGLHGTVFGRSSFPGNNAFYYSSAHLLTQATFTRQFVSKKFSCKERCASLRIGARIDQDSLHETVCFCKIRFLFERTMHFIIVRCTC